MAMAALCSLSAGSYSGRTGHADRFGSLLCHRLYRQEYRSPSGPEAASAEEPPLCNHQHFRQTAKKPQAAGLFRQWHEFSCSGLRARARGCAELEDFLQSPIVPPAAETAVHSLMRTESRRSIPSPARISVASLSGIFMWILQEFACLRRAFRLLWKQEVKKNDL